MGQIIDGKRSRRNLNAPLWAMKDCAKYVVVGNSIGLVVVGVLLARWPESRPTLIAMIPALGFFAVGLARAVSILSTSRADDTRKTHRQAIYSGILDYLAGSDGELDDTDFIPLTTWTSTWRRCDATGAFEGLGSDLRVSLTCWAFGVVLSLSATIYISCFAHDTPRTHHHLTLAMIQRAEFNDQAIPA